MGRNKMLPMGYMFWQVSSKHVCTLEALGCLGGGAKLGLLYKSFALSVII